MRRNNKVWRRRVCKACEAIFTTHEAPELDSSLMVQKNGSMEAFHRNRLFISIYESCKHRDSALTDAEALTETIIRRALQNQSAKDGLINIAEIIDAAKIVLNNFDKAAATYYGAYYAKK